MKRKKEWSTRDKCINVIFLLFCWFLILLIITQNICLSLAIFTASTILIVFSYLFYKNRDKLFISRYDANKIRWILEDSNPYEFEQHVADMFKRHGYQKVNVTKKSGDVGTDITMKHNGINYVVQVKKYSDENKIGRPDLQRLQGSAQHYHAQGMIFVTYGFFSSPAMEYAKQHGIETIDHNELLKLMSKNHEKTNGVKVSNKIKVTGIMSTIVVIAIISGILVYDVGNNVGLNYLMSNDSDDNALDDSQDVDNPQPEDENSEDDKNEYLTEYLDYGAITVDMLIDNKDNYIGKEVILKTPKIRTYDYYESVIISDEYGSHELLFDIPDSIHPSIFPVHENEDCMYEGCLMREDFYWIGNVEEGGDYGFTLILTDVQTDGITNNDDEEPIVVDEEDITMISDINSDYNSYVDKEVILKATYSKHFTTTLITRFNLNDGTGTLGANVWNDIDKSVVKLRARTTSQQTGGMLG